MALVVHESEDGRIELRHAGQLLPCSIFFDRNPHVSQGAIVANKRLSAALIQIQADQRERDRQRLASPTLTLRQKARIRADQERANASLPALYALCSDNLQVELIISTHLVRLAPQTGKLREAEGRLAHHYGRLTEGFEPDLAAIEQPVVDLTPAPAVSSFVVYDGAAFPAWRNDLLKQHTALPIPAKWLLS